MLNSKGDRIPPFTGNASSFPSCSWTGCRVVPSFVDTSAVSLAHSPTSVREVGAAGWSSAEVYPVCDLRWVLYSFGFFSAFVGLVTANTFHQASGEPAIHMAGGL